MAVRFAGARAAAARHRKQVPSRSSWSANCTPSRTNGSRPSSAVQLDVKARACREEPQQYLWRFGYGRADGKPEPTLKIEVNGHEEEDGHTWYNVSASLSRIVDEAIQVAAPANDGTELAWSARRRLCDLREELHDRVKDMLGPDYATHFDETPFARHGGPPGTTARLRDWLTTLASCANRGALEPRVLAYVLRCLEAPVPEASDLALLQAMGRCAVCTLRVDTPGMDVCKRCEAVREDRTNSPDEFPDLN
mmetsp:Transcript_70985/g.140962  ORF Transcript_70985/g.140962 Transcript_70985/m.140962 type:complete len:251 (-) Transcript_70985:57-809(-)